MHVVLKWFFQVPFFRSTSLKFNIGHLLVKAAINCTCTQRCCSRCRDDKGASGSHDDRKDPVRAMMIWYHFMNDVHGHFYFDDFSQSTSKQLPKLPAKDRILQNEADMQMAIELFAQKPVTSFMRCYKFCRDLIIVHLYSSGSPWLFFTLPDKLKTWQAGCSDQGVCNAGALLAFQSCHLNT